MSFYILALVVMSLAEVNAFISVGDKHFDGKIPEKQFHPKDVKDYAKEEKSTDVIYEEYVPDKVTEQENWDEDMENKKEMFGEEAESYDFDPDKESHEFDPDKEQEAQKEEIAKVIYHLQTDGGGESRSKRSLPEVRQPLPVAFLEMVTPVYIPPQALQERPPSSSDLPSGQVHPPPPPNERPALDERPMSEIQAAADEALVRYFPGQFLTNNQVLQIATYEIPGEIPRRKREVDRDICCKTDIWFGTAPTKLPCVNGSNLTILRGEDVFQAYARGDCHSHPPHTSCPSNGSCEQKTRLHTLWVKEGSDATLKYFRINSHCAYEPG